MERNIKIKAITLKKIQLGENNIGISLLTTNDEVLFVMAFGATKSKSKLFGGANPFVFGTWDLYFDPVKEYWRAKEVDITNYNSWIQTSLETFYTASLFAEIILKSQGCEGVYKILESGLHSLENSKKHKMVLVQFLLRFLNEQGLLPSFSNCSLCEKEINKESLFFNGSHELVCSSCFRGIKNFELNPGILLYCKNTPEMEWGKALKISLEDDSVIKLKEFLIQLIKIFTGGKLLTLNSSNGLI